MKTRDILVVDDDAISLLFFQLLLESRGFDVAAATDGAKALEVLESSNFRMLITDFNMPGMNGLELAAKAREQHPEIDVVLATAGDPSDLHEVAAEAGISRIFSKPVNSKTVVATIRSLLYAKIGTVGSNREYQQ